MACVKMMGRTWKTLDRIQPLTSLTMVRLTDLLLTLLDSNRGEEVEVQGKGSAAMVENLSIASLARSTFIPIS
jgi:hypothetical protein